MASFPSSPLPYAQATASQRAQLGHYLHVRLQLHFPTLPARAFDRVLAEFRPGLWFTGTQVALSPRLIAASPVPEPFARAAPARPAALLPARAGAGSVRAAHERAKRRGAHGKRLLRYSSLRF
jgi:hypothetical protein